MKVRKVTLDGISAEATTGQISLLRRLSKSKALTFELDDGSSVIIRNEETTLTIETTKAP